MNTKRTLLITVLWTLLLVPLLCQAGVLDHFCPACPAQACCPEVQCAADPCEIFQATRTVTTADISPAPTSGPVLLPFTNGTEEDEPYCPLGGPPATPRPLPVSGFRSLPQLC